MKIKLIALAVAALVSGAANASIDAGNVSGNGNVIFSAWDNNTSYVLNTGMTISSFEAAVASGIHYSFSSTALTNWLSTASGASFSVFAADSVGTDRLITTTDFSNTTAENNSTIHAITVQGGTFIGELNKAAFATAGVVEGVTASNALPSYVGSSVLNNFSGAPQFNNFGSITGNNSDVSMGLMEATTVDYSTGKLATYNSFGAGINASLVNGTFKIDSVAAVPEPESLAMLLAGMGLIGSIVRRRNRTAA